MQMYITSEKFGMQDFKAHIYLIKRSKILQFK